MAITPKPAVFTDSTLQNFQSLYDHAYHTAKNTLDTAATELIQHTEDLHMFTGNVRVRSHNLQEGKVAVIPPVNELKIAKNIVLTEYHNFVAILTKMDFIEKKIPKIQQLLAFEPQENEVLETQLPEFCKENKYSNEICLSNLSELEKSIAAFQRFKTKFQVAVQDSYLNYYLHRLCGLLDNAGLPLGMVARSGNFLMSSRYPIPLPEKESVRLPPPKPEVIEVKQKIPLAVPIEVKKEPTPPASKVQPLFKSTDEEFERLFSSSSTTGEEEVQPNEAGTISPKIAGEPAKLIEPPVLGATAAKIETSPSKPIEPPAEETAVAKTEAEKPKPTEPPVLTQLEPPAEETVVAKTEAEKPKPTEPPAEEAAALKTEPEEPKPTETPAVKAETNKSAPKEDWPAKEDRLPSRKSSRHKKSANKTEKT